MMHPVILSGIQSLPPILGRSLILVYVVLTIGVFVLYGIDKKRAIKSEWRIPEATLLLAAVISPFGALLGMYVLRHKTRKPKFYITVPLIFVAEIVAFLYLTGRLGS